jgi:hypothetical protein
MRQREALWTRLQTRLEKVRAWWNDEAALANVIAQGKYLKLCAVTASLEETADVSVTDDCDLAEGGSSSGDAFGRRGRLLGVVSKGARREPN